MLKPIEIKSKFIKVCTSNQCAGQNLRGVQKQVSDFCYICPDCKSVLLTKRDGIRKNNCAEKKDRPSNFIAKRG
jgi:hypothetical protein